MDSDTTFSLVPLDDDAHEAPSTPSPPSRSTSATRGGTSLSNMASSTSCLLRSTPTMLEHFAPLSPRAIQASKLAFTAPCIEDDSDATASCSLSLSSSPSSPSPSSSSRPSSPSAAHRTRSTRRRGSDSSDSEPDGPPVYFGTPSSAEHARRRKVSAKMRERRLLRRDSLDLARRRSVVPVMPSSDEPQSGSSVNEGSDTLASTAEPEAPQLSSQVDCSDAQEAEEAHSDTLGNEEQEKTLEADQDATQDCTMVLLADVDKEAQAEEREAAEDGEAEAAAQSETDDEEQGMEVVEGEAEAATAQVVEAVVPEQTTEEEAEQRVSEVEEQNDQQERLVDTPALVEEADEQPEDAALPSEVAEEQPVEASEAATSDVAADVEEEAASPETLSPDAEASDDCQVQVQAPSTPDDAPSSPARQQALPPPASPHTPTRPQRQPILTPQSCAIAALEGHSFDALSPGVALAAHGSAARGDSSLLLDALRHDTYDDSMQPDSPFAMRQDMGLEMEQPLYGKSPARELGGGASPLKRRRSARLSMRQELLAQQQQQQAQQTPSSSQPKEQASPSKASFTPGKTTVTEGLSAWAGSSIMSPRKLPLHLPPHQLPDWATGDASPRKPMRALERARALAASSPSKSSPVKAHIPALFAEVAAERARAAEEVLRMAAATPLPPASPEKPEHVQLAPASSVAAPQTSASGPSARLFENLKASRLAATQASDAASLALPRPTSAASSTTDAHATPVPGSALKPPSATSRLPGATSSARAAPAAAARPASAGTSAVAKPTAKPTSGVKPPSTAVSRLPKPASAQSGIARPAAASSLRKPAATNAARAATAPAPAAKAPVAARTAAPAPRTAPAAATARKAVETARPAPERKPVTARTTVRAPATAAASTTTTTTRTAAAAPRVIRAAGAASRAPVASASTAAAPAAAPRQASSSPTRAPAVRLRTVAPSPAQSAARVPTSGAARLPFVRGTAPRTANNVPASRVGNSPTRQERAPPTASASLGVPASPEKRAAVFASSSAPTPTPAPAPVAAAPSAPQVPSVYGSQAPPGRARRVPAASEAAIKTPPASTIAPPSVLVPATLAPPMMPAPASAAPAAPRPAFPTAAPLETERAQGRAVRGPFTTTQPAAASASTVVQPDLLVSPMKAARRARTSDEAPPSSDGAQSIEGATILAGKALRPRVAARTAQTITSQRIFSGAESKPDIEETSQPQASTTSASASSRRPARAAAARAPAPTSVLKAAPKESAIDLPLSHAELVRLTNQHTRRNEAYLAKLDVVTVRIEGPRPPSPTSKVRKVAGARMNKDEAALARERRARNRGSSLELDDDSDGEIPPMEAFAVQTHTLGAGEEEVYATPVRQNAAAKKCVKWHKALFAGPSEALAEQITESEQGIPAKAIRSRHGAPRSSLAAKEITLDKNGNITVDAPLSPRMRRTKVVIRKYVYDDDC